MRRETLCGSFSRLAIKTWFDLANSSSFGNDLRLGEESITDFLLLDIACAHSQEMRVHKYTKKEESRSGADWLWCFGHDNRWFLIRVQAKKLYRSLEYESLVSSAHKKKRAYQAARFIRQAKAGGCLPALLFLQLLAGWLRS